MSLFHTILILYTVIGTFLTWRAIPGAVEMAAQKAKEDDAEIFNNFFIQLAGFTIFSFAWPIGFITPRKF